MTLDSSLLAQRALKGRGRPDPVEFGAKRLRIRLDPVEFGAKRLRTRPDPVEFGAKRLT
jgi:hypothetical protein